MRISKLLIITILSGFNILTHSQSESANMYYVATDGRDVVGAGGSVDRPFHTLQYALDNANCASTIQIADGVYADDVRFDRSDCLSTSTPMLVTGQRGAKFTGNGATYIFEIVTGNITLHGFTIDGEYTSGMYRKKLVYISDSDVNRLTLDGLILRNAREECVRLRLNAMYNVISNNQFEYCGRIGGGTTGDNRESVYIGSVPTQYDNDFSRFNWVIDNTFNMNLSDGTGSECVDIKQNASHNVIQGNQCYYQLSDPESAGINISGHNNTIVNNIISDNLSSGIRLGPKTFNSNGNPTGGANNIVQGNQIRDNDQHGVKSLSELSDQELLLIRGNCVQDNAEGQANMDAIENVISDDDCAE